MTSSLDSDIASSVATSNARYRLRNFEAGLLIETIWKEGSLVSKGKNLGLKISPTLESGRRHSHSLLSSGCVTAISELEFGLGKHSQWRLTNRVGKALSQQLHGSL
jgi:hypothetical protein